MDNSDNYWFQEKIDPILDKVYIHTKTPEDLGLSGNDAIMYKYLYFSYRTIRKHIYLKNVTDENI